MRFTISLNQQERELCTYLPILLNPTELMFGHYKAYLKRHLGYQSSWIETHVQALLSVDPKTARNFFFIIVECLVVNDSTLLKKHLTSRL